MRTQSRGKALLGRGVPTSTISDCRKPHLEAVKEVLVKVGRGGRRGAGRWARVDDGTNPGHARDQAMRYGI